MFNTNEIIFVNTEHLLFQWVQQWQSWLLDNFCTADGKKLVGNSDVYIMTHWIIEISKNWLTMLGKSSKSNINFWRSKKTRNNWKILAGQFPWIWTCNLRIFSVKTLNWKGYVKLTRVNKPPMKCIYLLY